MLNIRFKHVWIRWLNEQMLTESTSRGLQIYKHTSASWRQEQQRTMVAAAEKSSEVWQFIYDCNKKSL